MTVYKLKKKTFSSNRRQGRLPEQYLIRVLKSPRANNTGKQHPNTESKQALRHCSYKTIPTINWYSFNFRSWDMEMVNVD